VKTARKVLKKIREEIPGVDFIEDLPDKPFSIHKIARDDDREVQHIDFPLMEHGEKTSLGEKSQILKTLPPTFRVGFIFANVSDKEDRKRIAERCRELRNQLS
ncbi:MAG TPA: hypothetical protein VM165_14450, partial [Planctomycetaceae bacterium]|nr:hypothetical protein [Planctomycetaceae bacterium]